MKARPGSSETSPLPHGHPAPADGVLGEAGDAVDVELAHDALAMAFDGADAQVEAAGNLLVAQAVGDLGEHLALARGKLAGSFLPDAVHELVEGQPRDLRAEEGLARLDSLDGPHQLLGRSALEHVTARPGLDGCGGRIRAAVHREDEHLDPRLLAAQHLGHRQAVHLRQVQVHQHDVRRQLLGFAQSRLAVARLANHLEIRDAAPGRS